VFFSQSLRLRFSHHDTQPSISILDTDDSEELQQFLIQSAGIATGFVIWAVMEYATLLDAHGNDDTSVLSAEPSSDDILCVHSQPIDSPPQSRTQRLLKGRLKLLVSQLVTEADATADAQAAADAKRSPQCQPPPHPRSIATAGAEENDVGLRTPATDPWAFNSSPARRAQKARPGPAAGWCIALDLPE
jgi:hypothetical protein